MTTASISLADCIEVRGRFRRSINLEKDYGTASQNGDYVITPTARGALRRLAEGMVSGSTCRAWTLTGPYGVGKSAFAVFLTRLLCPTSEHDHEARSKLAEVDFQLASRLKELEVFESESKGYLPVLVTARRMPAARCLAESIVAAASSTGRAEIRAAVQPMEELLQKQENGQSWDSRHVVKALASLAEASKSVGYNGVLVVIDELGKLFEYAVRYPHKGDVYVLQELAEQATRSGSTPVLLVGLLHQAFQEYGQHLDLTTRREWIKIQGRFEDIAFLEPADQVIRMIAAAIRYIPDLGLHLPNGFLEGLASAATEAGIVPPGMSKQDFELIAKAAYPLHPATLVALPFVFRRFAQNERSLFSFLSSMEPGGFQEFIKTRAFTPNAPPLLRLSDLFDYFIKNFGAGLYRHPHALRWLEAADVLERKENLSTLHREVVKTIGVLNALGEFCHLNAAEGVISLAVSDSLTIPPSLSDALEYLREQSIVTYRKFNHTYRIWEGSDVDIEERITEGELKIRHSLNLAESVKRYLPSRPLVARRHSFETGALRYFAVEHIDDPEAAAHQPIPPTADGIVLVCLAESPSIANQFRDVAMQSSDQRHSLFAIPQHIGELRAVVTELGALRWAWDNTPELRDDRVARREMSLRIADADQLLQRNLDGLLDPRDEPVGSGCLWIHAGQNIPVRSPVEVSQLLSDVCDRIYDQAPRIRNELITRRSLSSAAAAARRTLVERMLNHTAEEALGIQGYPPERSMYESVLRATELHRQKEDGTWGFQTPTSSDPAKVMASWNYLYDAVFNRQPEPIPLVELFAELAGPPYGVLAGLHPVLLCAFMRAYPDETTLYREGTFLPQPGIADFEVLMRRPDLFALAGSRIAGDRALVVERLAKGFKVPAATVPVVRELFKMVKSLPEFAWNTRHLPDTTLALRETFTSAKSPEQFLFILLPEALGLPAFSEQKPQQSDVELFFDVLNENLRIWSEAAPRTIGGARDTLLEACGLRAGETAWTDLRDLAVTLEPSVTDPQLLAFVQRLAQSGIGPSDIESVLALVATRPPQNWHDSDVERFPTAAAILGRVFRGAVRTAHLSNVADEPLLNMTPEERMQVDALANQVRRYLQRTAKNTSLETIRAAMMRLIQEMKS